MEGKYIVKYRWWIISFFILLTIGLGWQIPKAQFDPDLDNYLPADMPARINTYKIENIFGGNSMLMVVLESDDVLKKRPSNDWKNYQMLLHRSM